MEFDLIHFAYQTAIIVLIFHLFKLICSFYKEFKLYFLSQVCKQVDYRERYGEWVMITGATDGIGLAMAKEFARRGHSILAIGRNEEKLAATKKILEEIANVGEVETVKIDLSDSSLENYDRISSQIDALNRDIGILINNAGLYPAKLMRFHNFELDYIKSVINVNVFAPVYLTSMIIPGMLNRSKGLVINVSSVAGQIASPCFGVYSPTKSFIDSFSSVLSLDYSEYPIDIININPGLVATSNALNLVDTSLAEMIVPNADTYAKSVINAISTRYKSFSGIFSHDLLATLLNPLIHLPIPSIHFKLLQFGSKQFSVSPVSKRKRL